MASMVMFYDTAQRIERDFLDEQPKCFTAFNVG